MTQFENNLKEQSKDLIYFLNSTFHLLIYMLCYHHLCSKCNNQNMVCNTVYYMFVMEKGVFFFFWGGGGDAREGAIKHLGILLTFLDILYPFHEPYFCKLILPLEYSLFHQMSSKNEKKRIKLNFTTEKHNNVNQIPTLKSMNVSLNVTLLSVASSWHAWYFE